jgi:DNA-binding transcriptional LysR family regulator
VTAIETDGLDAAFVNRANLPAVSHVFNRVAVGRDDYVLLLPTTHPLVEKENIRLCDLKGEKFLWMPRNVSPNMHDQLIGACRAEGLDPDIVQFSPAETRIQLTAAGAGICFALAPLWEPWPNGVIARAVVDLSLPQMRDFVWRRHSYPALDRLADIVKACAPQDAA